MNHAFRLANRYVIDPVRNTALDTQTNAETRVEQRLMIVLCLLADQPGKLVSREKLIKDVWEDYGGADEALTQAISYLRKLLNDVDKKTIETVPKKGYILHAEIAPMMSVEPPVEKQKSASKRSKKPPYLVVGGSLFFILLLYFLFFAKRNHPPSPDTLNANQAARGQDTMAINPDLRPELRKKQDTAKSNDMK